MFNSVELLDVDQRKAYTVAMNCMRDPEKTQLIMFISGASGTGKSRLAQVIAQGAQLMFNTCKEHEFCKKSFGPVVCTAPTGFGAFRIGGFVWHSILEKTCGFFPKTLSPRAVERLQDRFEGVQVFVLDELNLVSLEDLYEINFRLCTAVGDFSKPFGGLHIVMVGDFYQMKTVSGTPIVRTDCGMSNSRAMQGRDLFTDEMTHYVSLTVNHRLSGLLGPLAAFVRAARLGEVSQLDLEQMNTRVVQNLDNAMRNAHPKAVWISDSHVRVDHYNNAFLQRMEHDLGKSVIRLVAIHRPSHLTMRCRSAFIDMVTKDRLFSINGGSAGGLRTPLIAPLIIDVCVGSRVRLTCNILPSAGLFSGAMGTVVGLVYRGGGQNPYILSSHLSDGDHELPIVLMRMDGDDDKFPCSCVHAVSRVVPIQPIASPQKLMVDGKRFTRFQIPIALAHARTAHSLSGYTAPHGIVSDVRGAFFAGQYVALSRTTTKEQLQLMAPLEMSHFTGHPDFRHCVNAEYKRLDSAFAPDSLRRL